MSSGLSARIGILGGGQLGRMLALAGLPLGMRFRFLDPDPDAPARDVGEVINAPYDDEDALREFARDLDAITYEFENVPSHVAAFLASHCPRVYPPPKALEVCQDRLLEKRLFQSVGLGTPRFAPVSSAGELRRAIEHGGEDSHDPIGLPCVLKTRRMGYDGKGQAVIRSASEIDSAFATVAGSAGKDGGSSQRAPSLIVESFVPFVRELSLICVRSVGNETRFYPLIENRHAHGILRVSIAPAPAPSPGASAALQLEAERLAARVLDTLAYVGVLTIELFQVGEGSTARLLGNELAPRVHNSGHWTIDGAATSQFENHLRAMLGAGPHALSVGPRGMSLGPTTMREGSACAAMVNIIGPPLPWPGAFPAESWCRPHLYAKSPRPGRKVGHVNVLGASEAQVRERIEIVRAIAASMQG